MYVHSDMIKYICWLGGVPLFFFSFLFDPYHWSRQCIGWICGVSLGGITQPVPAITSLPYTVCLSLKNRWNMLAYNQGTLSTLLQRHWFLMNLSLWRLVFLLLLCYRFLGKRQRWRRFRSWREGDAAFHVSSKHLFLKPTPMETQTFKTLKMSCCLKTWCFSTIFGWVLEKKKLVIQHGNSFTESRFKYRIYPENPGCRINEGLVT